MRVLQLRVEIPKSKVNGNVCPQERQALVLGPVACSAMSGCEN